MTSFKKILFVTVKIMVFNGEYNLDSLEFFSVSFSYNHCSVSSFFSGIGRVAATSLGNLVNHGSEDLPFLLAGLWTGQWEGGNIT